jgi:hypothetical protein
MSDEKETGWVHWVLHWHMYAAKKGVGEFTACGLRWRQKVRLALFRADGQDRWQEVPLDRFDRLLAAEDVDQATKVLRG